MTDPSLPDWARPSWKLADAPYPSPGPARASARAEIRRQRRPSLLTDNPSHKVARQQLLTKYGRDYWQQQLRKVEVRRSLKEFVKEFWEVIEPGTPLVWNWHIEVICDVLEKITARDPDYRRVIFNIPPGHMKSALVSIMWPAWQWLENPAYRSMCVTYVQRLTNDHARKCRDLVKSTKYQSYIPRVYGDKWNDSWQIRRDQDGIQEFGNTVKGVRQATSLKGAGTGLRGDDVIIDDPMNADEFPTLESLDHVNSWFDKRMSSRLNNPKSGALVIIMQRLHENDLCGHLLALDETLRGTPGWTPFKHVCLPTEFDPDSASEFDKRTVRGELLFPQRFDAATIMEAKHRLGSQFHAQHNQKPVASSGGIFPMVKIRFWYPAGIQAPAPWREKDEKGNATACVQGELPRYMDQEIQSWDLAFKDLETSDFVAGLMLSSRGPHIYAIDYAHGHMGATASCDAIRVMSLNWPNATSKYIEDAANGPAVIETLKKELMGIEPVKPDGGKVARAWAIEPVIHAGNLWLPHPRLYPWVHKLLDEMRGFPKGNHDDFVDALTQGVRKLMHSMMHVLKAMVRS